ncbi:MAG: bifunctional phosphopantothenoylcysteine decarboxylase/phosphopantothenate--cysteine ligase CoaBC [bacterium]|nr:bifunctional phosphopantothenoylcysteine decarboxylase/phosphopantothenate--cysteine ligase CoaBC [bacterium]
MRKSSPNREVVLGVTGSIAAYKACDLASRLVQLGVTVNPVLTRSAQEFVGRASFEGITGRSCITGMFDPIQNAEIEHIALATRAHLFLVAPATANILAKAAHGIADDWLSTTLLATRAPILFAPAMNSNMYTHPATQANIALLRKRGCHFVGPGEGRMACGTVGPGRLIAVDSIVEAALPLMSPCRDLEGKRVVITSGGTHEPIDPVRFIGNRSSGKMGRALAMEALMRGAEVTVVTGPATTPLPYGVDVVKVETAVEMAETCVPLAQEADVFIAAAAVADYRAEDPAPQKRKRTGKALKIGLVENPDTLRLVGAVKQAGQIVVGFAAETENVLKNARAKLKKKPDLIVANAVNQPDSGFGTETLSATIIDRDGKAEELPLMSKAEVAEALFDRIAALL